jgi:hypothetical protein
VKKIHNEKRGMASKRQNIPNAAVNFGFLTHRIKSKLIINTISCNFILTPFSFLKQPEFMPCPKRKDDK